MDNNTWGTHVEGLFDEQCRIRGITIRSASNRQCWDREVKIGEKVVTVQIKGTRTLARTSQGKGSMRHCYQVPGRRETARKEFYSQAGVDFIAIYVEPQNRWFVIPSSEANSNRIKISRNPEGKMKRALERWDYFLPRTALVVLE